MSEHWVYEAANVEGYIIKAPENWRYVVDPSDDDERYGPIYREADARLIAAAPELLEALENLLKVHEGEGGTQHHAGDMARAAISKAKGE